MGKLSHNLLDNGWFCVLGTTEHSGMSQKGCLVKRGKAYTYDHNNGTFVVYDEEGRPWIPSEKGKVQALWNEFPEHYHHMQQGAYVPHSNDGGHFVRIDLPSLFDRCPKCGSIDQTGKFCGECGQSLVPGGED